MTVAFGMPSLFGDELKAPNKNILTSKDMTSPFDFCTRQIITPSYSPKKIPKVPNDKLHADKKRYTFSQTEFLKLPPQLPDTSEERERQTQEDAKVRQSKKLIRPFLIY